jgi:predicted TIM-barrel fold metal-dependent hydrolase
MAIESTGVSQQVWDADNHYYEALDAFTRHLDPRWGPRAVQWAEINGRRYHVLGGRVSRAVVNPTFDPIAKPGVLASYFRGNPGNENPIELLKQRERIRPEYRDRAARVETLEGQGLQGTWLFPTLGMIYEEPLKDDPEAVVQTFRAFNRWLDEDWGFAREDGKIFTAPYITLADPTAAEQEVEWAIDRGAVMVVMRPAAPTTVFGQRPPTDPMFDGFWSRVNEAGIFVVVHAGDSGYSSQGYADDRFSANFSGRPRPTVRALGIERAAYDFLATLIFDKLFDRFPNVRVASIENGSEFLGDLFRKLRSTSHKMPGYFSEDPVDTYRRHIWMNPFWEDDLSETVGLMGADRVIFGSDWPHIEGLAAPLDYLTETKIFDEDHQHRILFANAQELATPRPR